MYFADGRNHRIRHIDAAGQIETVAGSGDGGYDGDGGNALSAKLNLPLDVARDSAGNLYIADMNNNRIRKVVFSDPGTFQNGVVTTIAGTGDKAFGGDGGPAIAAQLSFPQDLEIGPDGNLYFADADNNRVRMIDLATGIITTVAGNGAQAYGGDGGPAGTASLNRPFGVAFDPAGDLYISDTFNSRIRKVKR